MRILQRLIALLVPSWCKINIIMNAHGVLEVPPKPLWYKTNMIVNTQGTLGVPQILSWYNAKKIFVKAQGV